MPRAINHAFRAASQPPVRLHECLEALQHLAAWLGFNQWPLLTVTMPHALNSFGPAPCLQDWIPAHPSKKAAPWPSWLQKPHVFRAKASPSKGCLQCPIFPLPPLKTTQLGHGDSLVSDNKSFVQLGEMQASDLGCVLPVSTLRGVLVYWAEPGEVLVR